MYEKIKRTDYRRKSKCFNKNNQIKKGFKKIMRNYNYQLIYESILEQVLEEYPDLTLLEQCRLADEIFIESSEKFS